MTRDEQIKKLDRRVRALENKVGGGSEMSKLIMDLIGMDCTIELDYGEKRCRVMDADEEWVKLLIYGKKADEAVLRRIDDIQQIKLG